MLLRLRLLEFRCHGRVEFFPTPGRNHLIGQNGRGKTSLLEAVWFLSRLRSFRSGQPRELARWPGKGFAVEADCTGNDGGTERLVVRWEDGVRETFLDGTKIPMPEFWGRLPTVLLSAEDAVLIRGPAARRQAWLDALESLAAPAHLVAVQRHNAVLKQRNAWLRKIASPSPPGAPGPPRRRSGWLRPCWRPSSAGPPSAASPIAPASIRRRARRPHARNCTRPRPPNSGRAAPSSAPIGTSGASSGGGSRWAASAPRESSGSPPCCCG